MKSFLALFFILIGISYEFSFAEQANTIPAAEPYSLPANRIQRPPFYMTPHYEISVAYQSTRDTYFEGLPALLAQLKTSSSSVMTRENEFADRSRYDSKYYENVSRDRDQWEALMKRVYTFCDNIRENRAICDRLKTHRLTSSDPHRRQTAEDRAIEASQPATGPKAKKGER